MRLKAIFGGFPLILVTLAIGCTGPQGEFAALEREYQRAQNRWWDQMDEMKEEDEAGNETYILDSEDMPPDPSEQFTPRFRAHAEKYAGSPDALPALRWLIDNGQGGIVIVDGEVTSSSRAAVDWAVDQMVQNHVADPTIAEHLRGLRYAVWSAGKAPLVRLLEAVIEQNPEREAVASATYNLAALLYEHVGSRLAGEEGESASREADKARGMKLFRKLAADCADLPAGERAKSYIFEIENLQIGMKAPEIVGQDAEGKEIKLSQFSGQVVVLDFWGFW